MHTTAPAQRVIMTDFSAVEQSIAALTLAFADDPPCRWIWPEPSIYMSAFPRFVRAFGGAAFSHRSAFHTPGFQGVALWLPPGAGPDDAAIDQLIRDSVEPKIAAELAHVFEQMHNDHPAEPHWHLPLIGVDPVQQCRGLGSALLRPMLALCDMERLPAYLEATSEASAALYSRHGFQTLSVIQVGSSPPIITMKRPPSAR